MSTIRLKIMCPACDGRGFYPHNTPHPPCWTCGGRGWVYRQMTAPDPKWARLFRKQAQS